MSWSFNAMGSPAKIVEALQAESGRLTGQSKIEFDDALPHLTGLVNQNFADEGDNPIVIDFEASGSGSSQATAGNPEVKQIRRSCSASIKPVYKRLV